MSAGGLDESGPWTPQDSGLVAKTLAPLSMRALGPLRYRGLRLEIGICDGSFLACLPVQPSVGHLPRELSQCVTADHDDRSVSRQRVRCCCSMTISHRTHSVMVYITAHLVCLGDGGFCRFLSGRTPVGGLPHVRPSALTRLPPSISRPAQGQSVVNGGVIQVPLCEEAPGESQQNKRGSDGNSAARDFHSLATSRFSLSSKNRGDVN